MASAIFLISLFIFAVIFLGMQEFIKERRMLRLLMSLKSHEDDFNKSLTDFRELKESEWYISDRQYRQWKDKYAHLAEAINPECLTAKTDDPFRSIVVEFFDYFHKGRELCIDGLNDDFVEKESPVIRGILNAKGIKNNDDQVSAIASDEDNTLLVAGAGTGKTTTILGKLAYLLERAKIKPQDILLLSFTGRAVDELSSRISQKFNGLNIKAQTFHSFGLAVIGKALGKKPDLAFSKSSELKIFLDNQFSELRNNGQYLRCVVDYFVYYLKPVVLEPGFQNLDDYYKFVRTEQFITLKKEFLKSQQEVMIANFLYINGINYIYESPYKYNTANPNYKQYRPDFYLSEYDIYIEHFGVNKNGETRFTKDDAKNALHSEKYRQQMEWKRQLHSKNKTNLIETYSYEFTDRNWQQKLTDKLNVYGVKFSPLSVKEIYASLADPISIKQITDLFATFLNLSKSNGYSLERLSEKIASRNNPREQAFFDLFAPIYEAYEALLESSGDIDFHKMLSNAADLIRENKTRVSLKYIIIDEFQDFSVSKYRLVKALCEQNPDAKLFCVGDDWQSIFRFTGSDISLMTDFEGGYGFTRKNKLVITNRFNDSLAVVTNRFILKNSQQIQKEVRAANPSNLAAVEIRYNEKRSDTEHLLSEILGTLDREATVAKKRATVFILGRYKHNKPESFGQYQGRYKNLSIEFLTIHASKGSEADFVIIMDVVSGKYGFPTGVVDDPLLDIVLSMGESYPHAEERRLMYVAMTRARNKVYIMTEDGRQSVFVLELEGSKHADETLVRCQECGGEMVRRKGKYGLFYGCSNYPDCDHTEKIK